MNGYYWVYGAHPFFSLSGVTIGTPLPDPPRSHGVMLAVVNPYRAKTTSVKEFPTAITFLSPQPEPPDMAVKRYKKYLSELKDRSVEEALPDIMLAIPSQSWAMGTPMPLPPSMSMVFINPQPEPPGIAFTKYKEYLSEQEKWVGLYTEALVDAQMIVSKIEKEIQEL